ncbi:dehypoxanthine futalosine cyclase [Syntrophotalea acetylenivorans]|uniref:Cyclic dehypoxanthine futalosine synthase n=1 Tax=Syntrophotalea acetylenivorans TaxID=1842532 RepID=A0A1L3GRE6_9BACT|nr:cyclic dehypoxanthinyl futalosine synthase [Syntrophotalea acetylenivorans]APG28485.1 dehypoxanthine futalosine cyclase [Syntrophotalea acetylenivorans]
MLTRIAEKLDGGQSIDRSDALFLLQEAELLEIGQLADRMRRRLHPLRRVTFVVDRNVNYSNICLAGCSFCAFYRDPAAEGGYLLSHEQILAKVAELAAQGGTQLLLQGGLHPELAIDWFEELFQRIRQSFPSVQIHSLSPAEIVHIANLSSLSVADCLKRLREAGLASLPGGGAELLVEEVRQRISPYKIAWQQWAQVMREAHAQGMPTTATMVFGFGEEPGQIVEHLFRIRDLQPASGGFTAFIPWTFQPDNTALGGQGVSAWDYLKVLAVSRLVLDNIPNLQASWVTQGAAIAQTALFFGANDMGGTMLEENVVAAAGTSFRLSQQELIELVREAGFVAARRDTGYRVLEEYP